MLNVLRKSIEPLLRVSKKRLINYGSEVGKKSLSLDQKKTNETFMALKNTSRHIVVCSGAILSKKVY